MSVMIDGTFVLLGFVSGWFACLTYLDARDRLRRPR